MKICKKVFCFVFVMTFVGFLCFPLLCIFCFVCDSISQTNDYNISNVRTWAASGFCWLVAFMTDCKFIDDLLDWADVK